MGRLTLAGIWLLANGAAHAQSSRDAQLCKAAVAAAETARRIPDGFLAAIARVESGRPVGGAIQPWPWTVDADGQGSFYATKAEAIAAVEGFRAKGVRSIDVGCMQVNLLHHPEAFSSLDEAFDPAGNVQFAAGLLISLFAQAGSWPLAAAAYHSQTPGIGAAYQKQVLAAWAVPDRAAPAHSDPADRQQRPASSASPAHAIAPMPASAATPSFGRGMSAPANVLPPPAGPHASGKGLAAYRAMPVRLALRPPAGAG